MSCTIKVSTRKIIEFFIDFRVIEMGFLAIFKGIEQVYFNIDLINNNEEWFIVHFFLTFSQLDEIEFMFYSLFPEISSCF